MTYELKAEYEFRAVLAWHIIADGVSRSLCGHLLAPNAASRPISDLSLLAERCGACEAIHSLRTVLPDEAR